MDSRIAGWVPGLKGLHFRVARIEFYTMCPIRVSAVVVLIEKLQSVFGNVPVHFEAASCILHTCVCARFRSM